MCPMPGTYKAFTSSIIAATLALTLTACGPGQDAPISASVSVTSSDGGQQSIATTVVNETNGWLHLSAAGFTFSSPTLKVKLTQDANAAAAVPSPSSKPSASAEPAPQTSAAPMIKKSTITCVKGKVTKKVTAVSPKCPAGYKIKA